MERRRFNRLRTGQSYEMQGLIFFLSANYEIIRPELRQIVQESCKAAAGRSGNEAALLDYMTKGRTKAAVMMKYYIASENSVDRMVRRYFHEMERRLREYWGEER